MNKKLSLIIKEKKITLIFEQLVVYTPLKSMSPDYIHKTLHLQGNKGHQTAVVF